MFALRLPYTTKTLENLFADLSVILSGHGAHQFLLVRGIFRGEALSQSTFPATSGAKRAKSIRKILDTISGEDCILGSLLGGFKGVGNYLDLFVYNLPSEVSKQTTAIRQVYIVAICRGVWCLTRYAYENHVGDVDFYNTAKRQLTMTCDK